MARTPYRQAAELAPEPETLDRLVARVRGHRARLGASDGAKLRAVSWPSLPAQGDGWTPLELGLAVVVIAIVVAALLWLGLRPGPP